MKKAALFMLIVLMVLPIVTDAKAGGDSSTDYIPRLENALGRPLKDGKIILNIRARYELADQEGLDKSHAETIRTRLGYQTPDFKGFTGLIEVENTTVLDKDSYDAYPGAQGEPGKTIIADPRNTELNRALISYSGFDNTLALGRQRVILDNARFIGNVGWRQNEQTFDAVTFRNQSVKNLTIFYGYFDRANRIFGENANVQAQRYFEMDTHIFNITYAGCPMGKAGAYAYLIETENAEANSSDTYGAYFDGNHGLAEDLTLLYRAEYATQEDNSESPTGTSFDLDYYHLKLGAKYTRFNGGVGYESLEGNGARGFSTPLATLHKWNGWADVFLLTPTDGLEDIYAWAGVNLPHNIVLKAVFHSFEAEDSSTDYGEEYDVVATWKIDQHFKLTAKFADFTGDTPAFADRTKFWLQLDFNY